MAARRCVLAGVGGHVCDSRPQWHHPVKKQRIKGRFPRGAWRTLNDDAPTWSAIPRGGVDAIVPTRGPLLTLTLPDLFRDERNRIWACWAAHQKVENDFSALPGSVWEFAREFGLDAGLEGDIRRQA